MAPHRHQLLAAIALAVLLAGCGGGASSTGSSGSGGQAAQAPIQQKRQDVVRFADCMRSHGVPNFPDPTTSPGAFKESLNPGTAQSPAFQSATTTCAHLLPNPPGESSAQTKAHTDALLAFARCLRSHGFPNFPDPTSTGQITHEMIANAGISLHQPAVVQTADACVGVTQGVITKAVVARFVAGN